MDSTLSLAALAAIALGLAECFYGYRIFKVILGITGFLLGGLLAGYLAFGLTQSQVVAVAAGLIGGLIGAGLMSLLYVVGVFLIGAFFGAILAQALFSVGGSAAPGYVVVILALIAGVIAALFQKIMIVLATAFGGSWWALTGIATITGAIVVENPRAWFGSLASAPAGWLIGWFVLGVIGLVVQFRNAR